MKIVCDKRSFWKNTYSPNAGGCISLRRVEVHTVDANCHLHKNVPSCLLLCLIITELLSSCLFMISAGAAGHSHNARRAKSNSRAGKPIIHGWRVTVFGSPMDDPYLTIH